MQPSSPDNPIVPVARKPKTTKPPIDAVKGPRIDLIEPNQLHRGDKVTIKFRGKNLSAATSLSLGEDVTIIGVPFYTTPTEGTATIEVNPAARPGVRTAVASDREGRNAGPGGLYISPADVASGEQSWAGVIVLDSPCDAEGDAHCTATPQLTPATKFAWHEEHPVAHFYQFEISDADGKLLYSSQTKNTSLKLTATAIRSIRQMRRAPGEIYWRVRGYIDEGGTTLAVETSGDRTLVLPSRDAAFRGHQPQEPDRDAVPESQHRLDLVTHGAEGTTADPIVRPSKALSFDDRAAPRTAWWPPPVRAVRAWCT